jgi:hypothetical protein
VEEFRSSYGLAPNYRQKLTAGPLEVTTVGPDGEARAVELRNQFFAAHCFCCSFHQAVGGPIH